MRIAVLGAGLAIAATVRLTATALPSSSREHRDPGPLRGVPLPRRTGLRLVVAGNPPFALDVDSGRTVALPRVPVLRHGVQSVVGVDGRGAVVVAESVWHRAMLFAVRGRARRVSPLGIGAEVVSAGGGASVWIKRFSTRTRCTLARVRLDGMARRAARPIRCASTISPGGSLGLVVGRTRLVDPATGRTRLRTRWGIVAAAGRSLVLAGPRQTLTVVDARSGRERRIRRPRTVGGLDTPAVDPRGRFVALAFANPTWNGEQALDVWVLDTKTARLEQVPGMPVLVALKLTSMAWTRDGRLVVLGRRKERDFVAVWRAGQRRLAVKSVRLSERASNGSDTFAVVS